MRIVTATLLTLFQGARFGQLNASLYPRAADVLRELASGAARIDGTDFASLALQLVSPGGINAPFQRDTAIAIQHEQRNLARYISMACPLAESDRLPYDSRGQWVVRVDDESTQWLGMTAVGVAAQTLNEWVTATHDALLNEVRGAAPTSMADYAHRELVPILARKWRVYALDAALVLEAGERVYEFLYVDFSPSLLLPQRVVVVGPGERCKDRHGALFGYPEPKYDGFTIVGPLVDAPEGVGFEIDYPQVLAALDRPIELDPHRDWSLDRRRHMPASLYSARSAEWPDDDAMLPLQKVARPVTARDVQPMSAREEQQLDQRMKRAQRRKLKK